MTTFLVDENLPRSLAGALVQAGIAAVDVRDAGLRGRPDAEVFQHALQHQLAVVTADLGFANAMALSTAGHHGVVLVRLPNVMRTDAMGRIIVSALQSVAGAELRGSVLIVEPTTTRLRPPRR